MTDDNRQPISPAFTRTARWSFVVVLAVIIVSSTATSAWLLRDRARRDALARARLCAAALAPGKGGKLARSTDRLRSRYGELLAVASLDASGKLKTVHPDRTEYRRAAAATLEQAPGPAATTVTHAGGRETVWGVVLPLNADSSPTARQVLILLADEPYLETWAWATTVFVLISVSAVCVGFYTITRWFDRRIAKPLRGLAQPLAGNKESSKRIRDWRTGGWREMERIADSFRELFRSVDESAARAKRIERQAKWDLQRHAVRFDRLLRRAQDQATIDPLTGLHNRAFLNAEFDTLLTDQQAKGEDLAVVMLDVDNLKHYNDTYGHAAGDEVLQFIGELLRALLRPTDHAIRYGGDEFLLLLPAVNVQQARRIVERILKLFAQHAGLINGDGTVSLSAGVATQGEHMQDTSRDLLTRADAALYAAKRRGKNAVMAG